LLANGHTSAAFRCLVIHQHEPARQRARELAKHARVREGTAATNEGRGHVCGTEEPDRAAPLALTTHEVRAGAVLSSRGRAEHQATGALPQPTANTGSVSYRLGERTEQELSNGILTVEKTFC
jgi:hypothetical protein